MALQKMDPQRYGLTDPEKGIVVPGLEAFGPDLVPAWCNLGNVDKLCDRCQVVPWDLFYFEEHDFDDPLRKYSTSASSTRSLRRRNSFDEGEAVLDDFYAAHEWENAESYIDDKHQLRELKTDLDLRSEISASHERVNVGKTFTALSDVARDTDLCLAENCLGSCHRVSDVIGETEPPIERDSSLLRGNSPLTESENIYLSEGLRGPFSTVSESEGKRHSTDSPSPRLDKDSGASYLDDRATDTEERSQLAMSLTLSTESVKAKDMYRRVYTRVSVDSFGDAYSRGEVSLPNSWSNKSSTSFQYFGHIFRPHISRPDPMGPYIKFWGKGNGPSLADVREAAHRGCHLCTLIMTSLLAERSNRIFQTWQVQGAAAEVFDGDEILLYGRVRKSRHNGSCSRYLEGRIREAGKGVFGIYFGFSIIDEPKLVYQLPTARDKITIAAQAESIAQFWLHDCLSNHHFRSDQPEEPVLPSRIIVVRGVEGGAEPFLQESGGIRAKYATLSYCWGQSKHFRTTRATYAQRCVSIPLHTFPKTFRDAIKMTVTLGLDYLWIDAVCIIQDSIEDCQREIGSMARIYTGSTITLAAIGATSADSGFSISRNKLAMVDCRVSPDTVISAATKHESIPDSWTLHSRAWCFQEIQLSPRLLSCGAKELYFQCHNGIRREGQPLEFLVDNENGDIDAKSHNSSDYEPDHLRFCDYPPMTDVSEIYFKWYHCVTAYTQRDLTYSRDRLTAISGLASRFQLLFENDADRPTPQDYLAGLWRADLLNGLLSEKGFRGDEQRQPIAFQAPSWSWAATEATSDFSYKQASDFYCQVLEASVMPVSAFNPFGPVRSGKITLYGPVVPLPARAFYQDEFDRDPVTRRIGAIGGRMVSWDHDVVRDLGCVCLLLTLDYALVLSPVRRPGARTGIFQRVGFMGGFPGLPQSWKRQLRDGENADVEEFDLKLDVVTII